MKKAANIKIVSIDLFWTIIDIKPSPGTLWQKFLGENFSGEFLRKNIQKTNEIDNRKWDAAGIDDNQFKNVRTVLEETAAELFGEINLDYDPKLAANVIMGYHTLQNLFPDVKEFLNVVGRKYPVCLSTDADLDMLGNISDVYSFNQLFVSEELQAYKPNPKFFKHVISHYNVQPECILHIGDSESDIITPKTLGMQTCWLNRRNLKWEHDLRPDFEVKSLLEIPDLLD
jgi:HAD superfamily hydrolase (TIGR01549 family)